MSATSRRLVLALVGSILLGLAACAQKTLLEESWGYSQTSASQQMIANPDAGKTESGPIEGLDPITAEGVIENYQANQRQTGDQRREVFLIED